MQYQELDLKPLTETEQRQLEVWKKAVVCTAGLRRLQQDDADCQTAQNNPESAADYQELFTLAWGCQTPLQKEYQDVTISSQPRPKASRNGC